eukprot:11206046-Lingulodinium_polyedra.AAC.1
MEEVGQASVQVKPIACGECGKQCLALRIREINGATTTIVAATAIVRARLRQHGSRMCLCTRVCA